MTELFEKRGKWCYRDEAGKLYKFDTESEAKESLGEEEPEETFESKTTGWLWEGKDADA